MCRVQNIGKITGRLGNGGKGMKHEYANCSFCGGKVVENKVKVDYRTTGDELVVFEDVPAGVCEQCGEKYYTAKVARALELMAKDKSLAGKVVSVPVKSFPESMAI
jgi:YgiT-type zinc finger domain-containing protein